jgi:Tol biopolymer transport system component
MPTEPDFTRSTSKANPPAATRSPTRAPEVAPIPSWSPDGKKIVFYIFPIATGRNIYTVNANGSGLSQVTHGGDAQAPGWGTHPLAG